MSGTRTKVAPEASERRSQTRSPAPQREGRVALALQPRLVVGPVGDPAEQEADRVAAAVLHRLRQGAGAMPTIHRRTARLGRLVQRYQLDANGVVASLDTIEFLKGKLDAEVRGETVREHVRKAAQQYSVMFGAKHRGRTNEAMMLVHVLDGVADVLSRELVDPFIKPKLAEKLFELYRADIAAAIRSDDHSEKRARYTLGLTGALLKDDPVALYMHHEMRLETAAGRIGAMAAEATEASGETVSAGKIFRLLRERFEAEVGAYTRRQIADSEDKRDAYNVKESTGELSQRYWRELFGDVDRAAVAPGGGLAFTAGAAQRLDELAAAVAVAPAEPDAVQPRHPGMTEKQERHLRDVEAADEAADLAGARQVLVAFLTNSPGLGLSAKQAAALVTKAEKALRKIPLTITVPGPMWFGRVPTGDDTVFKPATQQVNTKKASEVFGGRGGDEVITHTGAYANPAFVEERGPNYLWFRNWKDRIMTGNREMTPEEMPTYAAANVNWAVNYGSSSTMKPSDLSAGRRDLRQRAETDFMGLSREDRQTLGQSRLYGENYYGDVHMLLKDEVRARCVYTATDHGVPHSNPLLAVVGFQTGETLTRLKDRLRPDMIYSLFNLVATKPQSLLADLQLEVQIFGPVDIGKDVKKIYVSPGTGEAILGNIKTFSRQSGVPYEVIKVPKGTLELKSPNRTTLGEALGKGKQK